MKLSEVIKTKGKFQQGPHFAIQLTNEDLIIKFFDQTLFLTLDEDWEELKPPRQWSEKELMLFKLLPDWAKWIAKDKDNYICIYEYEPIEKHSIFYENPKSNNGYKVLDMFDFLTITFEESPIYIGDLKLEEVK